MQRKWIYAYDVIWTSTRPDWKENVEFEEEMPTKFFNENGLHHCENFSHNYCLHQLSWKNYKKSELEQGKVSDETNQPEKYIPFEKIFLTCYLYLFYVSFD